MASDKHKRKATSIVRRAKLGGRSPATKDGDRRRRTPTDLVRDAIARKRMVQDWNIDVGPSPEDGGADVEA